MPTARELLEQADALMRRNRTRDSEADIPELTDEVVVAGTAGPVREFAMPSLSTSRQRPGQGDDVPELNDAVEELSIHPLPDDEDEVSRWLEVDRGEASITGPAPDSIAVVPPSTLRKPAPAVEKDAVSNSAASNSAAEPADAPASAPQTAAAVLAARVAGTLSGPPAESPPASDPGFDAMLGETPAEPGLEHGLVPVAALDSPAANLATPVELPAPVEEAAPARDERQWDGLAEEIRMQVLQRIDIFTDTGLHGELAARLQPIVDRASADLVTTINREVGQILRAYVAEAIEREIETWRESNP
jgi:hypothetical protein